ncbi:hypothetical protein L218DRAFT_949038 [Marasmius fiardii PR-910]|nr:hypothetical protein L218DRAFT_949038 [Marasmius fiardii PR-910]
MSIGLEHVEGSLLDEKAGDTCFLNLGPNQCTFKICERQVTPRGAEVERKGEGTMFEVNIRVTKGTIVLFDIQSTEAYSQHQVKQACALTDQWSAATSLEFYGLLGHRVKSGEADTKASTHVLRKVGVLLMVESRRQTILPQRSGLWANRSLHQDMTNQFE